VSSRRHLWRAFAVWLPGMYGYERSLRLGPKRPKGWNSASPGSRSGTMQQPVRPPRTTSCAVDLRNGVTPTSGTLLNPRCSYHTKSSRRKQQDARHNGNQWVRSSFLTRWLFRSVSVSTRLGGLLREDFDAALTEGSGGCQTVDGSEIKIEKPICAVFSLRRVRRTIDVLDQGVGPSGRMQKSISYMLST
jgi:hypothetical protein